jgi:hypothetical protein
MRIAPESDPALLVVVDVYILAKELFLGAIGFVISKDIASPFQLHGLNIYYPIWQHKPAC